MSQIYPPEALHLLRHLCSSDPDPLKRIIGEVDQKSVLHIISKLPKPYRLVVELTMEGLTIREIAKSLKLQPAAVRQRLKRAADMVRKRFHASGHQGGTDGGFWSMSRKACRRTGRWWWLRIRRRGWEGSTVKSGLLHSGRLVEILHGTLQTGSWLHGGDCQFHMIER